MSIHYPALDKPTKWLELMAEQLGVSIVDNRIDFPKKMGEGFFKQYYPFEWLTVSFLRFKVREPIKAERTGVQNLSLIPIVFYLNDSEQFVKGQQYNVGVNNDNGIFMPSSEIDSEWIFPANQWITNLTLTFNKEWLIKEIKDENSYVYNLLINKEPFYIFEPLSPTMHLIIQEISKKIELEPNLKKLDLYENVFRLFNSFLSKVNERLLPEIKSRIHSSDIPKLFQVRKKILNNISKPPSISSLSNEAGMSISKLQKCFKQVFGKNISQYALDEKMEMAKNLLASKEYSVSEVGYQLGYSNLSHFSKAFNKKFRLTPSAFLSSI